MGCQTKENCWLNELFVNRYRVVQKNSKVVGNLFPT